MFPVPSGFLGSIVQWFHLISLNSNNHDNAIAHISVEMINFIVRNGDTNNAVLSFVIL